MMPSALLEAVKRHYSGHWRAVEFISIGKHVTVVRLSDGGRDLVIKCGRQSICEEMFEAEIDGLLHLASAGIRIPSDLQLLCREGWVGLCMPWIRSVAFTDDHAFDFGRQLAALHRTTATRFGHVRDNFIGSLDQINVRSTDLCEHYRERRMLPMIDRCSACIGKGLSERITELTSEVLRSIHGPPALLHGDLWNGNVVWGEGGRSWLIDPAVSFGHREQDIGMMHLFGGFDQRCLSAYQSLFPLGIGWEKRIYFWQIYPLLVHVGMFGPTYLGQLERCVTQAERLLSGPKSR